MAADTPDTKSGVAALLCLLLVACSQEACYVKNADGSWREVHRGQWHYQHCVKP